MHSSLNISVIAGDGIGPEVTAEALTVAAAAADRFDFRLELDHLPVGAERFLATGVTLTDEDLERMGASDAIVLGALGDPRVPPGVLERGVIVEMRRRFRQAANHRPIQLLPGTTSPLRHVTPQNCDFVIVRENTEGLYAGGSSTAQEGTHHAVAIQTSITTYAATHDVIRYAFELAARRRGKVTVCHKTNILVDAGRLWSAVTEEVAADFPDVEVDYVHADAMTLHMVQTPERFDVVVTDNLFGDILSDLGAAITGGLGTAASGNLNLTGSLPSMFEPVHGSAPDIAGQGVANPAAAILSVAMMLDHLDQSPAAAACRSAVAQALERHTTDHLPLRTRTFGAMVAELVSTA